MSSLQDEYDWFRSGYWACEDPDECLCHGRGYALSDVDTWHECPIHHKPGMHHPEDECECGETICVHFNTVPAPPPVFAPVQTFADDDIPF